MNAALTGGTRVVQYRDKQPGDIRRKSQGTALLALCHEHDALLIINDDADLARAIGADGVHVGKQDGDIASVRATVGSDAVIGISCYNQLPLATAAQDAGVDYVAFGRFFPSLTKPDAVQADITLLREAKRTLRIPVVAIGGITPENGATLIQQVQICWPSSTVSSVHRTSLPAAAISYSYSTVRRDHPHDRFT